MTKIIKQILTQMYKLINIVKINIYIIIYINNSGLDNCSGSRIYNRKGIPNVLLLKIFPFIISDANML